MSGWWLLALAVVTPVLLPCGVVHAHPSSLSAAYGPAPSEGEAWGLSAVDWQRYLSLKRGPRGIWSPGLDPVTVLGVHARDDAERHRHAMHFVALEDVRNAGELAFQHMVNTVVAERYGDAPLSVAPLHATSGTGAGDAERWALFSPAICEGTCRQWVARALAMVRSRPSGRLDIYLAGIKDGSGLARWAKHFGIASPHPRFRLWRDGAWRGLDGAEGGRALRLLRRRAHGQAYVPVAVAVP